MSHVEELVLSSDSNAAEWCCLPVKARRRVSTGCRAVLTGRHLSHVAQTAEKWVEDLEKLCHRHVMSIGTPAF